MRRIPETDGHAGTTIDAVARQAEVSVQTIYAILASKMGRRQRVFWIDA
jgi:AcrR family transcriptional regulator